MKLFKVLKNLDRFFDFYDLYDGILNDRYTFTSLSKDSLDIIFYVKDTNKMRERLFNKEIEVNVYNEDILLDVLRQMIYGERDIVNENVCKLSKFEKNILKKSANYRKFKVLSFYII